VVRKGRRIGASTILAPRLIVAWMLVCAPLCELPPGETLTIPLISVRKGEAANRIAQISAVLRALGIEHEVTGEQVSVPGYNCKIRVVARNWKSVVGDTCGMLWCDEVSRWESDESSSNPAAEVMGSLRPTLATIPCALEFLVSSPWSEDDYHAQQFELGDTDEQRVAFIPSWVGNPTLSEEETRRLEPDQRIWLREYAAVPSQMVSAALDKDDSRAAFGMVLPPGAERRWAVIDASSLRGDCFAWMVGHESRGGVVIDDIGGWEDKALREVQLDEVVASIAGVCRNRGIVRVFGDQREEAGLSALFGQQKIMFTSIAWTLPSKHEAFLALRRLLRDRRMQLPEHAQLLTEMRTCRARLLPSGLTSYETNGLDYLSCLITLMHAYSTEWSHSLSRLLGGGALEPPTTPDEIEAERSRKLKLEASKRVEQRLGIARSRVGP
jgi:hypothetical protein